MVFAKATVYEVILTHWEAVLGTRHIPGQADEIIGRDDLQLPSSESCL